jgi:hypothetical protein
MRGHNQKSTDYGRVRGEQRNTTQLRVQLWSVNQRSTDGDEYPSLKFVTRESLVTTLQMNSHCGELLPRKHY